MHDVYYSAIQFSVFMLIFYIEALLHYNIGKMGRLALHLPPFKENLLMVGIIIFFILASTCIAYFLKIILLAAPVTLPQKK